MKVGRLLPLHDEPLTEGAQRDALFAWCERLEEADDRFYSGLVTLLADGAPFAWADGDPEDHRADTNKREAWLTLARTLPGGRRSELAELLRESGYVNAADQVPA